MYTDAGVGGRFPGDATPPDSRDSRRATLVDSFSNLICVADSISSSLFLRAIVAFTGTLPWRTVLCKSEYFDFLYIPCRLVTYRTVWPKHADAYAITHLVYAPGSEQVVTQVVKIRGAEFKLFVTSLGCCNDKLEIETGRYSDIDRDLRYCGKCAVIIIGDEPVSFHYI